MNDGWLDVIRDALNTIDERIRLMEGSRIWVKLTGDCCMKESCCLISSRLNWKEHNYWHGCTAEGDAPGGGHSNWRSIGEALGACIVEAKAAFTCTRASNVSDLFGVK
jgi:hypothetical protein